MRCACGLTRTNFFCITTCNHAGGAVKDASLARRLFSALKLKNLLILQGKCSM